MSGDLTTVHKGLAGQPQQTFSLPLGPRSIGSLSNAVFSFLSSESVSKGVNLVTGRLHFTSLTEEPGGTRFGRGPVYHKFVNYGPDAPPQPQSPTIYFLSPRSASQIKEGCYPGMYPMVARILLTDIGPDDLSQIDDPKTLQTDTAPCVGLDVDFRRGYFPNWRLGEEIVMSYDMANAMKKALGKAYPNRAAAVFTGVSPSSLQTLPYGSAPVPF